MLTLSQYKPFNPILGQTFQGNLDKDTELYMEHISHHPAITQYLIKNPNWELHGRWTYNCEFGMNYLDVFNEGWMTIKFKDGEEFQVKYPECKLKGIITGDRIVRSIGCSVVY